MELTGYAGSILYIDLTSGSIRREPLDPEMVRSFIGGWGINYRLAYDLISPDIDPLDPENCLIIGCGLFSGTIAPGSSELLITSRFPLNGAYATACGGGNFSLMLKLSGYDHVVISGRAERPMYLKIRDEDVELCDASDLWGRDVFETVDELRARHEPCSVIPIGQAGENLVKVSLTSIDKGGTVGSGGLAAVMGSKNLKAIVAVQGTGGIRVAHRLRLQRLVNEMLERIMSYRLRPTLIEGGFFGMTEAWSALKATISHDFTQVNFAPGPDVKEIHYRSRKPLACASCPTADKELNRLREGPYAGMVTYMTHYALAESYGGESAVEEYSRSIKFLDAANRYGICIFSFAAARGLMAHLYHKGVVTTEDTGGLELSDDYETTMKLLEMTAKKQGFGDVLAEGILGAARRLGRGEEEAMHIKGYYYFGEPRLMGLGTSEFAQMVNPGRCGGCAGIAGSLGSASYNPGRPVEQWIREAQKAGAPAEAMERIFTPTSFDVARLTKHAEDWYSLSNCLGRCHRLYINRFYDASTVAQLYSAITGVEVSPAELLKAGERAWNLWKMLNVRLGWERKDDRPPRVWFTPLKGEEAEYPLMDYHKTTILSEGDMDRLLDHYYEERGWDRKRGVPTPQKLKELGLDKIGR